MPDRAEDGAAAVPAPEDYVPYDARRLSYAGTFANPWKAGTIRTIEWVTGKLPLIRRIRRFERMGVPEGQAFFEQALQVMGIDLLTPEDQIARIPPTGPLVVVANHPHGLVDGLVMARLVGRVRSDYVILTRSLLTGIREIEHHMLPVPFPHEEDSHRKSIAMRNTAMKHLADGGVVILFPAGVVATNQTVFGPVVESEWNPFTAKMILKSGATVLPMFFPGRNTRLYHLADKISPTFRQGLLLHEIVRALNKPQSPVIGSPVPQEELDARAARPREFMAWLREHTLKLGET